MQPAAATPVIDGKYQIIRQLGEGGMGAVYEARHMGTGRRVAVKVIVGEALAKSADIVARFRREAMASGSIESQHIAQVLDTGVDAQSGSPYMVMEMLVGEDVQQAIRRVGPFAPELALRVVAQACLGLHKAHEAGVVHRDIKPANLYIARRDGGDLVVKLLDFGIAKVTTRPRPTDDQLTRSGVLERFSVAWIGES
jgi:serine/threonine-protein kinase